MKKIVFAIALMMASTLGAFAEDNSVNKVEAYTLNINNRSLSRALSLSLDQEEICSDVIKKFENDMLFAASNSSNESRKAVTKNAVDKNLRYMKMFLSEKQYKKYVMLLNATLTNRGIKF